MNASRSVVYFAFLGDETTNADVVRARLDYMDAQLRWLAQLSAVSGTPVDGLVPYVAPRAWDEDVRRIVSAHGFQVDPASVAAERLNRFEYPGFRAMKALAVASPPDRLIYYCHSKGIIQLAASKMGLFRLHSHVGLTADLSELSADPTLTRAGLFPSKWGWCWYNFFWIKAGHMARLPVEPCEDRYQFEALIGDQTDREGYRGVLPLIGRLPFAETGIAPQPWYRAAETSSPTLEATHYRYARMAEPPAPAGG